MVFFIECNDLVLTGILLFRRCGKDAMEEENDTADGGLEDNCKVGFTERLKTFFFVSLPHIILFNLFVF